MSYTKIYFLILLIGSFLGFVACEEVIVLELDESVENRLVIEGILDADSGICTVKLTESNGFYDAPNLVAVAGATISLAADDGTSYSLSQTNAGIYQASDIVISPEQVFNLTVTAPDGTVYEATAEAPYRSELDSLEVVEVDFPFGDERIFQVFPSWKDTPNILDYYRLKAYRNDTFLAQNYLVLEDLLGTDGTIRLPIRDGFREGDEVEVELLSIDKSTYDYFYELSELSDGAGTTTPFNPANNINNNGLGYFGIMTSDSKTVLIE